MFYINEFLASQIEPGDLIAIGNDSYVIRKLHHVNQKQLKMTLLATNHSATILIGNYVQEIEVALYNNIQSFDVFDEPVHYFNIIRAPKINEEIDLLKNLLFMPNLQKGHNKDFVNMAGADALEKITKKMENNN